jgi:hypothetical protein
MIRRYGAGGMALVPFGGAVRQVKVVSETVQKGEGRGISWSGRHQWTSASLQEEGALRKEYPFV